MGAKDFTMKAELRPIVDIIMPVYNNLKFTQAALNSLYRYTETELFRVIVVDNGSQDETTDFLKNFKVSHGNMELIISDENLGWCKGLNVGFRQLHPKSEYVLWANNDILFEQDWLPKMLKHFRAGIGAVGPTSNYVSGRQCVIYNHNHYEEEAPVLIGFFLMFRREVIDLVGDIDERFGLGGGEEYDYLLRMKKLLGLRCVIARDVYIHHFGSKTLKEVCTNGTDESYNDYCFKMDQVLYEKWGKEEIDKWLAYHFPEILIGIVHPEYLHWRFWLSEKALRKPPGVELCNVVRPALVYEARNDIVKRAKEIKVKKLLMIDADMIFPTDALFRLMDIQVPIAAGYFFSREKPHFPCAMRFAQKDGKPLFDSKGNKLLETCFFPNTGVQEVDGVGAAFTLYDMRVFEEISEPWFYPGAYGEDIDLCVKARDKGMRIKVDTDLIIKHIGYSKEIGSEDFEQGKSIGNEK